MSKRYVDRVEEKHEVVVYGLLSQHNFFVFEKIPSIAVLLI